MSQTMRDTAVLDEALNALQDRERVFETMHTLVRELYERHRNMSPEVWHAFAVETCRRHPLLTLLQQDPFTARAFQKPRGYAGDAEMLDFIYAPEDGARLVALEEATALGAEICGYTANGTAPRAVRARRRILVDKVDEVAARTPRPRVLSVACGHLREATRSLAFREGRIGHYVALDQDRLSLAVVERELGPLGVETVHASVRDLVGGRVDLAPFDLIHVSGLHDYLSQRLAQRLSEALFALLNPRGHLIITNYLPDLDNIGYMEAFMDWWLIYRTPAQLAALAETLAPHHVEAVRYFHEENGVIAFLEVVRAER